VFTIGGAQAVAALAYGTATVPQVDKIVGPGNAYVAAAKRRVFGTVGIDMIAGPSEILVICDGNTDPDWVAMDLFSQAEHDELAQSILLRPMREVSGRGGGSIEKLLPEMPRRAVIEASLTNRGALIKTCATSTSLRAGQPHRAGAPGTVGRECRNRCCRRSATPARSSLAATPRGAGRLLRRTQPRVADLAHRAFLVAAGRV
jgi:hypothetical protein